MSDLLDVFLMGLLVCGLFVAMAAVLFGLFMLSVAYPWVGWPLIGLVTIMVVGSLFVD